MILVFVEPNSGIGLDEIEVDLMAEQFADVTHAIPEDVSIIQSHSD